MAQHRYCARTAALILDQNIAGAFIHFGMFNDFRMVQVCFQNICTVQGHTHGIYMHAHTAAAFM